MSRGGTKPAREAAGNLLISANYLSRGTSEGLKGFVSARERSKIEAVRFVLFAESKTNKKGDNRARENGNAGGGMFNPHLGPLPFTQLDGPILDSFWKEELSFAWVWAPVISAIVLFFCVSPIFCDAQLK